MTETSAEPIRKPSSASSWKEAMRPRTLPASIAGVAAGAGCACYHHGFRLLPMLICLLFALLAQIASNFANEYYDYRNGLDRKGREGFRRGVTEGDISPGAMKRATYATLGCAALLGCSLIIWGGWWLVPVGILIALFAIGYSAGPYPLSHHGLGDVAVVVFFGLVPVIFTDYVQTGTLYLDRTTVCSAIAIGLLTSNILIVNNYRDRDDDAAVGKRTTVVIFGRKTMGAVYALNYVAAAILLIFSTSEAAPSWVSSIWVMLGPVGSSLWTALRNCKGHQLNDILKYTAMTLLAASVWLLVSLAIWPAPVL